MIFQWLRRERREPTRGELLAQGFDLDLCDLMQMLINKLETEEPNAQTMVLIAFTNASSDLRANKSWNEKHRADLPTSYADFGRMVALLFDKYPPTNQGPLDIPTADEVKYRRLCWFYQAAILGTASERAHATNTQLNELTRIWQRYIESAKYLPRVVKHNRLWSDDEKEWFGGCTDENSYVRTVLYTVVPKFLWEHDEMLNMAKQRFDVWPSLLRFPAS